MDHTKKQLKEVSDRLYYEIWMLYGLKEADDICVTLHNAILESFAIHARVIIKFFFCQPYKDEAVAKDFFTSPDEWDKIKPEYDDVLNKARDKANLQVAHITYSNRKNDPDYKYWYRKSICDRLQKAACIFKEKVSPELLGDRWNKDENNIFAKCAEDQPTIVIKTEYGPIESVPTGFE